MKKLQLLIALTFCLAVNNVSSQVYKTITTGSSVNTSICAGGTVTVPFFADINYISWYDMIFVSQLSDANGSFTNPTNIGSISYTDIKGYIPNDRIYGNYSMNATIPIATIGGTGYRIRVVSYNPSATGSDNGQNITVINDIPSTPTITAEGATTFCGGGSVALTASTGTSYLWSNGEVTKSITTLAGGSYTVKVTNAIGCFSAASDIKVVTVKPTPLKPIITEGGSTTFCPSGSVQLTGPIIGTNIFGNALDFDGINDFVNIPESINPSPFTGNADHTIEFNVLYKGGQTGDRWLAWYGQAFVANALEVIGYDGATGKLKIHHLSAGNDKTATTAALSPNVWTHVALVYTGSNRTMAIYINGVYIETFTYSADLVIPANSRIQLGTYANVSDGFNFSCKMTLDEFRIWNISRTPSQIQANINTELAGTESGLKLYYNFNQGTDAGVNTNITKLTNRTSGGYAGDLFNFTFSGTSSNWIQSTSSGTSYLWSNLATTQSITATTGGIYTLQVTNVSGCQSAASAGSLVTVNVLPSITSSSTATTVLQSGSEQNSSLAYSATTGTPTTYSISWSGSAANIFGAVTDATLTSGSISIVVPASTVEGTYSGIITVKNANGCVSTENSFTLTVSALPTISTSSTASSVYQSTNAQTSFLNYSATTSSPTSYSISWNGAPTNSFAAVTDAPLTSSPINILVPANTASGTYTGSITVKDANGFVSTGRSFTLTINAYSFTASETATAVCQNSNGITSLSYNIVTDLPTTYSIIWTGDAASLLSADIDVNLTENPISIYFPQSLSPGTYTGTITVRNTNGFVSSGNNFTFTVNPLPPTPIIAQESTTTFCQGGSVLLTATEGSSYLWSNNSTNQLSATTQSITVSNEGSYTVRVTNANGCLSAESVAKLVTVNPLPNKPTISTPNINATICDGSSLVLTASEGNTYLWSNGLITQSITVTTAGSYTVRVANANGCLSVESAASEVTACENFSSGTISSTGETICYNGNPAEILSTTAASGSGASITYKWQANGVDIENSNSVSYDPPSGLKENTTYTRYAKLSSDASSFTQSGGSYVVTVSASIATPVITTPNATSNSIVSTLSGSVGVTGSVNGNLTAATFNGPSGLATDAAGNIYVADEFNHLIRKITPEGLVSTLAGNAGVSGSLNGTGTEATFNNPVGVATDAAGNVYVADQFNSLIRKITPLGVVSTLAGNAGVSGSENGTGSEARFNYPSGVATDAGGNVYVADQYNNLIRKITPSGVVSTLAGSGQYSSVDGSSTAATFSYPSGVATDAAGNVYVVEPGNHLIRKITPSGVVSTLAGSGQAGSADGTGTVATFSYPFGLATDAAGNVYVADQFNSLIRKITPSGVVSTLAGNAGMYGSVNGDGSQAKFNFPIGLATDAAGNVYVADKFNHLIRKISSTTGSICNGGNVLLTASEGNTYLWSNGLTTQSITVTTAGSYTVRVTNANGCLSAESAALVVPECGNFSSGTISSTGETICYNGNPAEILSTTAASGSGASITYKWQANGVDIENSNSVSYDPPSGLTVTTTYTRFAKLFDASNFTQSGGSYVVTVNPLPSKPTITAGGPTTFTTGGSVVLTSSAGSSYRWFTGATTQLNETTQSIKVSTAGSYKVTITDANGCQSAESNATDIVISNGFSSGSINSDGAIICYNEDPASIISTSSALNSVSKNAFAMDGVNDYATAPAGVWFNGNYTIETWIYPRTFSNWARVIDFGNGVGVDNVLLGYTEATSGKPSLVNFNAANGNGVITSTTELVLNQWSHLAVSFNGTTATMYINGVEVATGPMTAPNNVTRTSCLIGKSNFGEGDPAANGIFDELRIWNVARSQAEIQAAMNVPLLGSETGLQAYYNFDQGTAEGSNTSITTITDRSSNARNASLYNVDLFGTNSNFVAGKTDLIYPSDIITYKWQANGVDIENSNSVSYDPPSGLTVTTAYTRFAKLFDASNFTQSGGSYLVTVNPLPSKPTITAGGPTTFTIGGSVVLTSSAGSSYLWSNNETTQLNETTQSITVSTAGSYTVRITDANGCQSVESEATGVVISESFSSGSINSVGETICSNGDPAEIGSSTVASNVVINNALDFDGTNDFIDLPTTASPFTGNADHTIEFDVLYKGGQSGDRWMVWYGTPFVSNTQEVIGYNGETGKIKIHHVSTNNDITATSAALTPNVWTHVALVYTGSSKTTDIYINGVKIETFTYTDDLVIPDNSQIQLGTYASYADGINFSCKMTLDEFRVWNVARTQAEIEASMHSSLLGSETGLQMYYNFDQGTANGTNNSITSITDRTSNARDASLNNIALTGTNSNFVGGNPATTSVSEIITYKWQANGVDIANSNSPAYNPPSGLTETTTYRRYAIDGTANASFTPSTGSYVVTVNANYTITASEVTNGSISSPGVTTMSCDGTEDKTYTITPAAGYLISDVTIDGISATALTTGSYAAGGTYEFTNVQGNHTISVTFALACTNVGLAAATATSSSICADATTTLTYSGLTGTNASVKWAANADGTGTTYGTASPSSPVGPGTYYAYATGDCGSAISIEVKVATTPTTDNITTETACDSYTWNGTVYTTSGIKTGTTTNCVTEKLDLTITPRPAQPTNLACYESVGTFNADTCQWNIVNTQTAKPLNVNCWDDYQFVGGTTCSWVNVGSQPAQPTNLACYQSVGTFNTGTCQWNIVGEQPAQPTNLACYESVGTFNTGTCQWNIVGTAPALPQAGTDGTLSVDSTPTNTQLFAALTGADEGGSWTHPAVGFVGVHTYTVTQAAPCSLSDSATVTVSLSTEIPNGPLSFCAGAKVAAAVGSTSLKFYTGLTGGSPLAGTTALTTKTYYVTETTNSGPSARVPVAVTVNALPATPSALTSLESKKICKYIDSDTPVLFSATATDASSYIWTTTINNITEEDITNDGATALISFKKVSKTPGAIGSVKVQIQNANGCISLARELKLSTTVPTAPTSLTMISADSTPHFKGLVSAATESTPAVYTLLGLDSLTAGIKKVGPYMGTETVFTLTATEAPTAASYAWTLPDGVNPIGDVTGNIITVTFDGAELKTIGALPIVVQSVGGCGTSTTARTLTLSRAVPTAPTKLVLTEGNSETAITKVGAYTKKSTQLTLTATPFTTQGGTATSYAWKLPTGVTCISQHTTDVTLTGSTTIDGVVTPWTITDAIATASSTITIDFEGVDSGVFSFPLSVYAVNGTGNSKARTLTLTAAVPATPAIVGSGGTGTSGQFGSCSTKTYTATLIPGATYTWTVPAGAQIVGATNGYVIEVNYSATSVALNATSTVTCSATNGTGNSATKSLTVKRIACTTPAPRFSDVTEKLSVVAYPNPSSTNFNLNITTSSAKNVEVKVYDMIGKLINKMEVSPSKVAGLQIGDRYPSGVYNVIVSQGTEVKTLRVIKQ